MTKVFEGTSKTNLTILEPDPARFDPVQDIGDLVQQWIPFQSKIQNVQQLPELKCVVGSAMDIITANGVIDNNGVTLPTYSGLIGTVMTAYSLHQNIVLRPDDVWTAILGQFSAYVNGRAEELRSKFVNHDGQMELQVEATGTACNAPYDTMTRDFLDEIAKNLVDPTLKDWFLPGFSTSTFTDEVVASASAMCAFQSYFTYTYSLVCGIPQVTLLGTLKDWKNLRAKVERLVEFDGNDKLLSEQWVPLLRRVLDNFVESATNGSQNNLQFWDHIVQYALKDVICTTEPVLSGWLSVFTFFDGNGQVAVTLPGQGGAEGDTTTAPTSVWPTISFGNINHNVVSCPTRINDNGVWHNATMYVGQMAYDYVPENLPFDEFPSSVQVPQNENAILHSLVPRNDWAMAIQKPGGTETAAYLKDIKEDSVVIQTCFVEDDAYNPLPSDCDTDCISRNGVDAIAADDGEGQPLFSASSGRGMKMPRNNMNEMSFMVPIVVTLFFMRLFRH